MAFQKKQKHASGKIPELGAIFMANRATKKMCFSWKTFGLPLYKAGFVRQVKAGMFLFLFEYETRKLYGVYQACCDGDMNLSSEAFSSTGNMYPAQVQFRVLWYCKPLSEDEFRPAIKDNYFAAYKFNFGLSKNQVRELLWLFNSRKLRDEVLQEQMLPGDPFLIHATPRSCSINDAGEEYTFRAQNEYVPENTNDHQLNKDLDNLIMPNREVHGRLLIDADRDVVHEDAEPVLPFRDGVNQVRDTRDYDCNSKNDYELNSEVPYVSSVEKYDPDIPLFDMPATQQLPEYHEGDGHMWDGRVYVDNSMDGRPLIKQGELQNFTRYFDPVISNSSSPRLAYLDNAVGEGASSYNPDLGTSLQGCGRNPKVHLNPDFFRGSDSSINVEHLKPLSENRLLPSETDDASVSRQHVAYYDPSLTVSHPIPSGQFQSCVGVESFGTKRYEDALLPSSASGRTHEMDTIIPSFCMEDIRNPVGINQHSEVCEERQPVSQNKRSVFSRLKPALDADDEPELKDSPKSIDGMVNEAMEMLNGHYLQLLKKSCSMRKQVDDDENLSKIKEHQTFLSQAAKYESVAPVEMVSDLPTANENEEFESEFQIIEEMPLLNFKRRSEVQKTRNAAEGCLGEMSPAILAEKQSKRRKLVRPSLINKELSDDSAVLDKFSLNMALSCQPILSGSLNTDAPLPCDRKQKPSEAGNIGSVVLAASVGNECGSGLTGSNNLTDDSKQSTSNRKEDQRAEMSINMELQLGVSLNDADLSVDAAVNDQKQKVVSVAESANTGSDKSVGMDGSQQELRGDPDLNTTHFFPVKSEDLEDPTMGRDEVHVESTSISLLADGTSASGQATQVQYFEFFI